LLLATGYREKKLNSVRGNKKIMISICKKIISGLCFILIVSSLVQITSAQALEMKNKINI